MHHSFLLQKLISSLLSNDTLDIGVGIDYSFVSMGDFSEESLSLEYRPAGYSLSYSYWDDEGYSQTEDIQVENEDIEIIPGGLRTILKEAYETKHPKSIVINSYSLR